MAMLARNRDGDSALFTRVGPAAEPTAVHVPVFGKLADEQLEELLCSSSNHHLPRRQVIYCEGEELTHLYLVQSGSVKLIRHSEEGKELIVRLVGPGECFGAVAKPVVAATLAQALEDTLCFLVPLSAIRRSLTANPELAVELLTYAESLHQQAEARAARLAFDTVPRRLAQLLLEEAGGSGELRFPLNQTEIANLIGSSRETVCSLLSDFRRGGMLRIERGQIRILDRKRLSSVR